MLESGTFTLKGDERLTIGTYLQLEQARYYVEGVTHHFRQATGPSDGQAPDDVSHVLYGSLAS